MTEREFKLDHDRYARLGFDEAIFCHGKSVVQLTAIIEELANRGDRGLLTRLSSAQHDALPSGLRECLDYDTESRVAFFGGCYPSRSEVCVAVVTAGTSDSAVASEVERTLRYYGEPCLSVRDVGVAGLWRLLERVEELRSLAVVIVVAGLDAALPSVIGGLVPGLLIAVPTSCGYGVSHGGTTALHAVLASCAPGIVVVNIDNGFGAACAALRALATPEHPGPRLGRR